MRKLVYLSSADDSLIAILDYIAHAAGSADIARRFVADIEAQCAKLAELPGTLGVARPELRPDIRCFPFRGYLIFFRYAGDEALEIVSILEGHRDVIAAFGGDG
jgi:plasmid stabilization system protein ParE